MSRFTFGARDTTNRSGSPSPGAEAASSPFPERQRSVRVLPSGRSRNVAVIGTGYVGLPTAALLAHLGHHVVCGDADAEKVAMLQRGEIPIVEEHLPEFVARGVSAGRLRFVVGATEAVRDAAFVFLCVPTPQSEDGSADLSYIEAVAEEIGPHLLPGCIVVNKSTVPVGSTLVVERVVGRHDISVVSNPEFLREGSAVEDSLHPERIVVGAADQSSAAKVGELFAGTHAPLIVTDAATAETIKYASNAFLATKLSFVNAVAGLCEAVGADARDVILALGYDRRIGFEYLRPGPGWGGSCLPKDTRALVHIAKEAGYSMDFLEGAIETNERQLQRVVDKVAAAVGGDLSGSEVAAWGLTFKAGTDDLRNSPAVDIVSRLVAAGASVTAFEPTLEHHMAVSHGLPAELAPMAGSLSVAPSAEEATDGASVLVVLTEWDQFRWLDFVEIGKRMATPSVVDARNLLDPAQLRRLGFAYSGIGRQ